MKKVYKNYVYDSRGKTNEFGGIIYKNIKCFAYTVDNGVCRSIFVEYPNSKAWAVEDVFRTMLDKDPAVWRITIIVEF